MKKNRTRISLLRTIINLFPSIHPFCRRVLCECICMCVCVYRGIVLPRPRGLQFRVDMQGGISFCILHVCRRSHKRNEMEVRYHLRAFHLLSTLSLSESRARQDVPNAAAAAAAAPRIYILHIFLALYVCVCVCVCWCISAFSARPRLQQSITPRGSLFTFVFQLELYILPYWWQCSCLDITHWCKA